MFYWFIYKNEIENCSFLFDLKTFKILPANLSTNLRMMTLKTKLYLLNQPTKKKKAKYFGLDNFKTMGKSRERGAKNFHTILNKKHDVNRNTNFINQDPEK